VRSSPDEWATTHRFAALIGELFPGSPASKEFEAGVEKFIRINDLLAQVGESVRTLVFNP